VTSIVGNTLHFDLAMGIDVLDPQVRLRPLASDFGAENIKFSRTNQSDFTFQAYHLKLDLVYNSYVRNNEFSWVGDSGAHVERSRRVVIQGNTVHDTHWPELNHGSKGLGISASNLVSEVKIVDNDLSNLRHHIELVNGVNHAIVAYNNIEDGWFAYADIGAHHGTECHNILFEGNIGNEILTDDRQDPQYNAHYIVQFRNLAIDNNNVPGTIGTDRPGDSRYSIVGNVVPAAGGIHSEGTEHFVGANIEGGQIQWGYLDPSDCIVPSLFLNSQPPYGNVHTWPLYGPPDSGCP
jgi:hypothetical protein